MVGNHFKISTVIRILFFVIISVSVDLICVVDLYSLVCVVWIDDRFILFLCNSVQGLVNSSVQSDKHENIEKSGVLMSENKGMSACVSVS